MKEYIQKLIQNQDLTSEEAEDAISRIFTDASDAQIAAFLTALKIKGEAPEEIAGLARGMKKAANTIKPKVRGTLVDTCGTKDHRESWNRIHARPGFSSFDETCGSDQTRPGFSNSVQYPGSSHQSCRRRGAGDRCF
ncbi:MAG: hypothetical protein O8C55_14075 [Candidatus Methanoperedens sp.]|nr:hypothetical protein [Candidatus Methanoperedens sp.]